MLSCARQGWQCVLVGSACASTVASHLAARGPQAGPNHVAASCNLCLTLRPPHPHRLLAQAFGEVRSLYTAAKARGFVVVGYYDTRAATLAQHTLSGQALGSQRLDVHFSLPKDDREANQVCALRGRGWWVYRCGSGWLVARAPAAALVQAGLRGPRVPQLGATPFAVLALNLLLLLLPDPQGTLLVGALSGATSRQELLYLFSQYGELREVRAFFMCTLLLAILLLHMSGLPAATCMTGGPCNRAAICLRNAPAFLAWQPTCIAPMLLPMQVRDDPARPGCFLLEFYDTRHAGEVTLRQSGCAVGGRQSGRAVGRTAERCVASARPRATMLTSAQHHLPSPSLPPSTAAAALQGITQLPEIASRLVVMEAGAAVPAPQQAPQLPPVVQQQAPVPPLGPSLSHDYLAAAAVQQPGGQYGGGMRNVGSSPALLYGSTQGSSSQLDYLQGGMAAAASLQQLQQAQQQAGGYPDAATAQLLSAAGLGAAGLSAASLQGVADPLASMNRSFSEMSLDSTAAGLGSRYAPNSLSTGDLLAMTQGLQGEERAGGVWDAG